MNLMLRDRSVVAAIAFVVAGVLRPVAAPALPPPPPAPADAPVRYDGSRVVRVHLGSVRDWHLMHALARDCWTHTPRLGEDADFLVGDSAVAELDRLGVEYATVINDVQALIDEERDRVHNPFSSRAYFDDFRPYQEMRDYLDQLVALRPGLASRQSIGLSLGSREIFGIRIEASGPGPFGLPRLVIFLNSMQHAREWLAGTTTMYLADQIVRGAGSDPVVDRLLERYAIVIVPVVNPDGYVYTWTTDRFWRKNRRDNSDGTFGVDLNRNWSFKWGSDHGSSGNGNNETFRGAAPFSEPETAAMRDYLAALNGIVAAFDVHTSGQLILSPWGWTNQLPEEIVAFNTYGSVMRQAILGSTGAQYRFGPAYSTLYPVSGANIDWWLGEKDVLDWTLELRGPGFNPPPTQILPTGREILAALTAFADSLCLADVNRDTFVTGDDFDRFVADFVAGAPRADFNRDGFVTGDDIDMFVAYFAAGC